MMKNVWTPRAWPNCKTESHFTSPAEHRYEATWLYALLSWSTVTSAHGNVHKLLGMSGSGCSARLLAKPKGLHYWAIAHLKRRNRGRPKAGNRVWPCSEAPNSANTFRAEREREERSEIREDMVESQQIQQNQGQEGRKWNSKLPASSTETSKLHIWQSRRAFSWDDAPQTAESSLSK